MGEDKGLLRIGGVGGLLAGMWGSFAFIAVVFFGLSLPTEETLLLLQELGNPPDIPGMVSLILSLLTVFVFLALHRVLRNAGSTRALVGVTFGVSGALIFAANWAIGVTAWPVFADLHAGAPPAEQTMIVFAAEVVEQVQHGLQSLAQILTGLAFISFGWVLLARNKPATGYGWAGIVLGGIVALHALVSLAGFPFALIAAGFGGLAALFLLFGWKVYSLSRTA